MVGADGGSPFTCLLEDILIMASNHCEPVVWFSLQQTQEDSGAAEIIKSVLQRWS